MKAYLSRKEVAEMFGVTWHTIWKWTVDGKLNGIKLGDSMQAPVMYRKKDIEKFFKKYGKNI